MERMPRIIQKSRATVWVAMIGLVTVLSGLALAQQQGNNPDAATETSLKKFLQTMTDDKTARYVAAFHDLNGDGTPEAIVYLISNDWCGSAGCNTLIVARDGDSWKLVTNISITNPPIRVLASSSKGWHNIGVWVRGGGIRSGYEAELRFNGRSYPRNPSVLPTRKSKQKAEGKVVIASEQNAVPLY
jgi:hypothetical protein